MSSDLLEILYTSQFEGAKYKSKFRKIGAKTKISSDLLKNMSTSQFEGAKLTG